MKNQLIVSIFITLTFFVAIIFLVNNKTREITKTPEIISSDIPTDGKFCFTRYQEATDPESNSVEEHIVLNFAGVKVNGTKFGLMKKGGYSVDGYDGTLAGSTVQNEMELTYSFTIEGWQGKELEVYGFDKNNLIKKRWGLHEVKINGEDILVPDYVGEPTLIAYEKENCSQ